jgi:hypothetical protein
VEASEDGLGKEHLVDLEVAEEASHHLLEALALLGRVITVEIPTRAIEVAVAVVLVQSVKVVPLEEQVEQDWPLLLMVLA